LGKSETKNTLPVEANIDPDQNAFIVSGMVKRRVELAGNIEKARIAVSRPPSSSKRSSGGLVLSARR
jgi:hypothetical protein